MCYKELIGGPAAVQRRNPLQQGDNMNLSVDL